MKPREYWINEQSYGVSDSKNGDNYDQYSKTAIHVIDYSVFVEFLSLMRRFDDAETMQEITKEDVKFYAGDLLNKWGF